MEFFHKWFRDVLSSQNSLSEVFNVVDPLSVGPSVRALKIFLDGGSEDSPVSLLSIFWVESNEKLFEKKFDSWEKAQEYYRILLEDLKKVSEETTKENSSLATEVMLSLQKKLQSHTDPIINMNRPPVTTTNASKKQAKIIFQNIFFDTPEEAKEYQEKMKALQPDDSTESAVPLWDELSIKEPALPSSENDLDDMLAPSAVSYDDLETEKVENTENMTKRIEKEVKEQLESALDKKKATLFTDKDYDLVNALRGVGRTWEEVTNYLTKELKYDKDSVAMLVDSLRQVENTHGKEPMPEAPKPPVETVSPETHDKLIEELTLPLPTLDHPHEDDLVFSPKEEEVAEVVESLRADNRDIKKVATTVCPECGEEVWDVASIDQALNKCWNCGVRWLNDPDEVESLDNSMKKKALNPLQDPVSPADTEVGPPTDPMDAVISLDRDDSFKVGNIVVVLSDLESLEGGFEGEVVSTFKQQGDNHLVVKLENGDLVDVPAHRAVNKRSHLERISTSNKDVIDLFVSGSFPKTKRPIWGTNNLKIVKQNNGWALVNYSIPLLYKSNEARPLLFNTQKYSVTTSKIQSQIRSSLSEHHRPFTEVVEAAIIEAISSDGAKEEKKPETSLPFVQKDPAVSIEPTDDLGSIKESALSFLSLLSKVADEGPQEAVPTTFKPQKIAPPGIDREKAEPATPELAKLVSELQATVANLNVIQDAVNRLELDFAQKKQEIEEKGGRVSLEKGVQDMVEKIAILIEATNNKIVQHGDLILSLKQEVKTVPYKPTDKWKLEKLYDLYEGAREAVDKAVRGAQSLASKKHVRDLFVFPKLSKLDKTASLKDELNTIIDGLMEALRKLSVVPS